MDNVSQWNRTPKRTGFPCAIDFTFWVSKQAESVPSWGRDFLPLLAKSDINQCVNAHAGVRTSHAEMEAGNLCSLIRLRQHNLSRALRPVDQPACLIAWLKDIGKNNDRRARYAKRWAKRLANED